MLLIIEALLILAALGQDHRSAVTGLTLDMAPDSVDDYYYGCRVKMANKVEKEYLKKERDNSEEFNNSWVEGEKNAFHDNTLKRHNSIAIYVYTNTKEYQIYPKFNDDTRNGKQEYTARTYKWYSLQFLLTEAIESLRKKQNKCFKTFRGTKLAFNGFNTLNIRFGSFTSSSLNRNLAKRFGSKSCFEIYTCLGADVTKHSRLPYEKEVLIPPYEKFKVTDIKTRPFQKDLWCETVFTLESSGTRSNLNCALFKNQPRP